MPAILSGFSGETATAGLSVLMILAKVTVVLVAALVVTRAMERGSAVSRHLVWFVSLGALLLIPALASWSPLRLAILPAESFPVGIAAPATTTPAPDVVAPSAPSSRGVTTPAPSGPNVEATVTTVRNIVSPKMQWFGILRDPKVLFAIWAAVAVMFASWLAYGAYTVHRIIRRSRVLDAPEWMNPLWEVADRLELASAPRLVRSEDAKMPFACGLLKPTIVLPAECDSWTLDRRRAVLLHELAHIRRRDLVGHTIGRFACALYWFHPLVWTAAKHLRSESERACDDLALNCGARASDYAEHLLDIVTGVRHHATPAVAMAMARRKEFEGRMLAILDPDLRRGAPSRRQTVGLVGGLAMLSLVVGAAVPVARAADASDQPTGVAASSAPLNSDDTLSFVDEERAQSVRTVQRTDTQQRVSTRTRTVGSERRNEAVVAPIASPAAPEPAAAPAPAPQPSVAALTRSIMTPHATQGRADDRPALLANVLKSDTSASLRRVAAWGLAQFANNDVAADALAGALRRDTDSSVREMAAWALADARKSAEVMEALSTALRRDANPKVRASAAWALGNIGDAGSVEALVAALGDSSRGVRLRAVWAIGNSEPKQAPKALLALLSDREAEVRQIAAWALFNIQDPDAVPALDAAMQRETDRATQRAIIRALAATGEKSVEAIKRLIDSKDAEVRSAAIRALAGGGSGGPWPWPWPEPRPYP